MDNKWNWKKAIPSWEFVDVVEGNYPEWERHDDGEIYFVLLRVVRGISIPYNVAAEVFDDVAKGKFHFRIWTISGINSDNHPIYYAGFWFEKKEDAVSFQESFGGVGNWQSTYENMVRLRSLELGRE